MQSRVTVVSGYCSLGGNLNRKKYHLEKNDYVRKSTLVPPLPFLDLVVFRVTTCLGVYPVFAPVNQPKISALACPNTYYCRAPTDFHFVHENKYNCMCSFAPLESLRLQWTAYRGHPFQAIFKPIRRMVGVLWAAANWEQFRWTRHLM